MSRDKNVKVSKWGDRSKRAWDSRSPKRCDYVSAENKCTRDPGHQGLHYDIERRVAFK